MDAIMSFGNHGRFHEFWKS